jgi:hypothetical protein
MSRPNASHRVGSFTFSKRTVTSDRKCSACRPRVILLLPPEKSSETITFSSARATDERKGTRERC